MIKLADAINTILQCIMIILSINYCTSYKNENSKVKVTFLIVILWFIITTTTYIVGNSSLGAIFIHLILILSAITVFRKDSLGATIAMSIVYLAIIINNIIMSNIFLGYVQYKISPEYYELGFVIFMYVPHFIMQTFIILRRDLIYRIYIFIRSKKVSMITLIITTLIADFVLSFNFMMHDLDNPLFKNTIFVLMGLFIVGITFYFANIEKKSKEINLLNEKLEQNINELKKLKHDYGAQISYLYGMHLMGKYDRLGESLKSIINGHENLVSEIEVASDDSIISMIVKSINHKGISVIVDEQASLRDMEMPEIELQRVISNIFKNAVSVMDGKGIITIRTYYGINNIIIKMQNNGPEISKEQIDNIFNIGFTTKDNNSEDHGFGLTIVKEIVERYRGKVEVASTEVCTEFTVKIPIKINL